MLTRYCLLDLETISAPDALDWLPPVLPDPKMVAELETPVEADKRLTDPVKIAADIAKKTLAKSELPAKIEADIAERKAAQFAAAALDADVCQIIAVGMQTEEMPRPAAFILTTEAIESNTIEWVWQLVTLSRPMVGYGLTWFDLGVLVRRSQLLNVLVPSWVYKQGKYRHDVVIELADYLTLNGMIEQKKGRTLDYHCRRFGIQVDDAVTGKDVAELWKNGDHESITKHVIGDIDRIRQVAERLGRIPVGGSPARLLPTEQEKEEAVF